MFTYDQLRQTYPSFVYDGYQIEEDANSIQVTYDFEIKGLAKFAPSWVFPKKPRDERVFKDNPMFLNMVFSLGLVELVSYWKITCSPTVSVTCGSLNEKQINWWKSLYYNGLGEFYYTNNIQVDEQSFMTIEADHSDAPWVVNGQGQKVLVSKTEALCQPRGCLVPVGGGKDSAVTLDLLKGFKDSNCCYIINPRGATLHTVEAAGYDQSKQLVTAKRTLDKTMIDLNKQGYLNGHTPYSAIVAFSSTIAAYLYQLKYIVLSNESSANESTVAGSTVNHQYSKSFQFENDFHTYEKEYIGSGTYYFSMLRPLSEFQIAKHFAKCDQYHAIFRSCNAGSKEDIWCGKCPKCLFVYLILSPFLSQKRLQEIFGTDMLNNPEMKFYFSQLIGVENEKPFECVGSRDEINTAICMAINQIEKNGSQLPYLFEYYMTTGLYEGYNKEQCPYTNFYDQVNLLPESFANLVKEACLG